MTSAPNAPGSLLAGGSPTPARRGEELIAASLLMLAGLTDLDELNK
jgi:hypothetical protein